jgi:hypothetical protein
MNAGDAVFVFADRKDPGYPTPAACSFTSPPEHRRKRARKRFAISYSCVTRAAASRAVISSAADPHFTRIIA